MDSKSAQIHYFCVQRFCVGLDMTNNVKLMFRAKLDHTTQMMNLYFKFTVSKLDSFKHYITSD